METGSAGRLERAVRGHVIGEALSATRLRRTVDVG